mmetsp:Transcript_30417/g.77421  ORF Transcript_30417/g.77421 Transcript_30417/m.77421 type:complete len:225 (+) Transcript_30417:1603-2277(+)
MPFSSVRRKFGVESLITPSLSLCMFLIQRLPWPCGSIISGQRRPRVTRMPFSMDRSSEGSDLMFHSRVSAGSHSTSAHFQFGSAVRLTSLALPNHCCTRSSRNSAVKGPAYAMKPAARVMLPTTNVRFFANTSLAAAHRTDSLPRPESSFSARTSLTLQVSASCSRVSALFFARMSCSCSPATLSCTSFRSAFAAAALDSASAAEFSAAFSFSFFGSIARATRA